MSLEYVALGMLIFFGIVFFYGIIAIHDIPYEIAKKTRPPAFGSHSLCRLDKHVHTPFDLALPVDLGDDLSRRSRLWLLRT